MWCPLPARLSPFFFLPPFFISLSFCVWPFIVCVVLCSVLCCTVVHCFSGAVFSCCCCSLTCFLNPMCPFVCQYKVSKRSRIKHSATTKSVSVRVFVAVALLVLLVWFLFQLQQQQQQQQQISKVACNHFAKSSRQLRWNEERKAALSCFCKHCHLFVHQHQSNRSSFCAFPPKKECTGTNKHQHNINWPVREMEHWW